MAPRFAGRRRIDLEMQTPPAEPSPSPAAVQLLVQRERVVNAARHVDNLLQRQRLQQPEMRNVELVDALLELRLILHPHPATPRTGPASHAFVRSDNPNFGAAFGGGCAAMVDGTVCGWPERVHGKGDPQPGGERHD